MSVRFRLGVGALGTLLAACEMEPAEVLDAPRLLALRVEPAELVPGEAHTLSALVFDVAGELVWSLCPDAWRAGDPPSCPEDGAVALGRGNPLTVTLPAGLEALWLRVDADDGSALPAVKRIAADSGAVNPSVLGVRTTGGQLPESVALDQKVELVVALGAETDPSQVVVSWYVTAGRLEPARTLGDEVAELHASAAGTIDIIAVVRDARGGSAWTSTRIEVRP